MNFKRYLKKIGEKAQVFDRLSELAIGVVVLALILVIAFLIMSETAANTTVAANPNATLAIATLQSATADIPNWVPLIVIGVIGLVLLGFVGLYRRVTQ